MRQVSLGFGDSRPVGVIGYSNRHGDAETKRAPWNAIGIQAVLRELGRPWVTVEPHRIDEFQTVLLPITSVTDQIGLIRALPVERRATVIAGGQGCYAIQAIRDRIDVAVFGRCEGSVMDIVEGKRLPSVWRREDDPDLSGQYRVNRESTLLPGEVTVGCKHRCAYCQYTWTRTRNGETYRHQSDLLTPESTFVELSSVVTRPGRYTAALDGFSFASRARSKKGITRAMIVRTLTGIQHRAFTRATVIKVFQIVGYPWETEREVIDGLAETRDILREADVGPGRVVLMFTVTPFSPEPLTPMQCDGVPWIDWHAFFADRERRAVYSGDHLEAFVLPQIQVPWTLAKRVVLNRCSSPGHAEDLLRQVDGRVMTGDIERIVGPIPAPPLRYLT